MRGSRRVRQTPPRRITPGHRTGDRPILRTGRCPEPAALWLNPGMFKAVRITLLLLILLFVAVNAWLTKARSTDWNNSLWVKVYPINADGSDATAQYIAGLGSRDFAEIEAFAAREAARWGCGLEQPVRMEIGATVTGQPPLLERDPHMLAVAWWSLEMRWWAGRVTDGQDRIEPDVSIFVRYHDAVGTPRLDDSVGVQKGMFGIVNAYTGRRYGGTNNVIIAHELLHTLGATDKYELGTGQPLVPDGLADAARLPIYPQASAEIMAGRIALAADDAVIPQSLQYAVIGATTAAEIGMTGD